MSLYVVANNLHHEVLTRDEQGIVVRSVNGLIAHAANRHACRAGGPFYLNIH